MFFSVIRPQKAFVILELVFFLSVSSLHCMAATPDLTLQKTFLYSEIEKLELQLGSLYVKEKKSKLNALDKLELQRLQEIYKEKAKSFDELEQKVIDLQPNPKKYTPPLLLKPSQFQTQACDSTINLRIVDMPGLADLPTVNQGNFGVCYAIAASEMLSAHSKQALSYTDIAIQRARALLGGDTTIREKQKPTDSHDSFAPPPMTMSKLEGGGICSAINVVKQTGACSKESSWTERQVGESEETAQSASSAIITKDLALIFEDLRSMPISNAWKTHGKTFYSDYLELMDTVDQNPLFKKISDRTNKIGIEISRSKFLQFYRKSYLTELNKLRSDKAESVPIESIEKLIDSVKFFGLKTLTNDDLRESLLNDLKKTEKMMADENPLLDCLNTDIYRETKDQAQCVWNTLDQIENKISALSKGIREHMVDLLFSDKEPWEFIEDSLTSNCQNGKGRITNLEKLRCVESDYLTGFFGGDSEDTKAYFSDQKLESARSEIMASLKAGSPAGISYCSGVKREENRSKTFRPFGSGCNPHAAVVVGTKFDQATKQCSYLIQESDGDDCRGVPNCEKGKLWLGEKDLVRNLISISRIEK